MRLKQIPLFLFTLFLLLSALTGCSQKFNDVNDTMKLALFGETDAQFSAYDIEQLPYASIYARIDDGPQAFMVLALAEKKANFDNRSTTQSDQPVQLKWLSTDRGMLVTEHGRIVKSQNIPQGNLVATTSHQADPLALGLHKALPSLTWQRKIDWHPGYHFGYQLNSQFEQQGNAVIIVNDRPITTLHFIEMVSIESLDIQYKNDFWIHPDTGKILKSRQKLAPGLPYVEITLLKPYS